MILRCTLYYVHRILVHTTIALISGGISLLKHTLYLVPCTMYEYIVLLCTLRYIVPGQSMPCARLCVSPGVHRGAPAIFCTLWDDQCDAVKCCACCYRVPHIPLYIGHVIALSIYNHIYKCMRHSQQIRSPTARVAHVYWCTTYLYYVRIVHICAPIQVCTCTVCTAEDRT